MTSRRKRLTKADQKKTNFNYESFRKKLELTKQERDKTYFEIAVETGICLSLIAQICSGKYKSEISMRYATILADWMNEDLCNYLTKK